MTAEEDDVNDHPIEEVRLTVSTADDPTIPSLTFRTWVLGLVSCLVLSFMNQFFSFRSNALYIGSVSVQIMVLPLGKLMAAVLPRNPGPFSLNPGPFNLKEHVLITIFANCGASGAPGLTVVAAVRAFYHRHIDLWAALLLILTTQLLGYGWAGMFRKYLVDSPHMWWPSNLVQVSLFRALHETEKRDKGGHTRLQFFTLKDSITAQQIGSGLNGLGVGSFGLDWSTVAGFLGSPLATPLSLMAAITHVALFNGKSIWEQWKKTTTGGGAKDEVVDVHTRMMRKSYEAVPQWWFTVIMIVSLALSFFAIEGFNQQLQLPWWALILACALAFALTLPSGIILATTNQPIYTDVIAELLIGYIYPGKPLANITFKAYSFISTIQALSFLSDFKLGHYMKIPPKSMFLVQIVGTLVGSTAQFATTWSLISSIDNICDIEKLPQGSPWTCPGYDYFYTTSILWGVVGPRRILDHQGIYSYMKWFFLIGTLAPIPVWMLARKYPEKKWIESFHVPIFLSGAYGMLPARPVHFLSWGAVGVFFNYYVYRKYKGWWARHTYILSAALDAGVAFMAVLVYFTLQSKDVYGPEWWGLEAGDHCSLAKCPTVPGIVVDGCPAIY
ncbi:Oligopeptide transporter 8 [Linum perenne]